MSKVQRAKTGRTLLRAGGLGCCRDRIRFRVARAANVDLLGLAQLPAVITLGHRSSFFLDFEQRPLRVLARRRPVAFDTCLAVKLIKLNLTVRHLLIVRYEPSIFLVVDENHRDQRLSSQQLERAARVKKEPSIPRGCAHISHRNPVVIPTRA